MADSKPAPPAAGDPRFTTTVTLAAPTGTPDVNTYYVFTNTPVPGTQPSVGVPPTHNAAILGVNIGLTALALIIVILRVFSRWKFSRPGWDDVLVSLSAACAICIMAFQIHGVQEGMGKHIGDLTDAHFIVIEHYHWLSQIIYCVCVGFAKVSMCVFLLRFHPDNAFQYLRKAIIGMIGFVTAFAISSTVATICTCRPPNSIWNNNLQAQCVNRAALIISISSLNILTDLLIVLLPIPMILKLQVPMRQKLTLGVIFCLGLVVCIASAIRMTTLHKLTVSADASWDMAKFSVWTALEFNLAIICSSAPALKPLIRHYSPKILGSSVVETARSHLPGSSSRFRSLDNEMAIRSKDSYMMTKISGRSTVSEREARQNRFDGKFDGRNKDVKTFYSSTGSSDEMILGQGITRTIEIDVKSLDAGAEAEKHHGV